VATACGLTLDVRDDLREYHMGELEHGWAVRRRDYDAAWAEGSWTAWPGGETRDGFRARIATLLADLSGRDARTLVVTHGGVVNELLSLALHGDVRGRFRIDLTGMSRLLVRAGTAVVGGVNDVWHLEDPLALPLVGVPA
jgi:2,3-bisphosphoglycerate-dependent phosphoglycerate mutase